MIIVKSIKTNIFYKIGYFLLKQDDPRKAKFFPLLLFLSVALSSTNYKLIFALSKVSTLDWNIMKSGLYADDTILLSTSLTQIEFLYELYYIWYSVYGTLSLGIYYCIELSWDLFTLFKRAKNGYSGS